MHYLALVVIPQDGDPKEHVERLMGPHTEQYPSENGTDEISGHWDWYQIGGRWTGYLDGYKADSDPANIEVCNLCNGTGVRRDAVGVINGMVERNYCNGCQGKGKSPVWPTARKKHDGDVQSVAHYMTMVADDSKKVPYALLLDDGTWIGGWPRISPYSREGIEAAESAAKDRMREIIPALDPEKRIVVVDYHS